MKNEGLKYLLWAFGVTVWLTICFIVPYFIDSPSNGFIGLVTIVIYIAACSLGTFFLVCAIGCYRYLCAFFIPLLSILGAALSFYLLGYKTTLTPMLIDVTLHTNTEEAIGVVSWQVIIWVIVNLCIAGLFIWLRWTRIHLTHAWIYLLTALIVGTLYFSFNGRLQNSLCQRFPYNIPYTLHEYSSLQKSIQSRREIPSYQEVTPVDSLTIVLIIGEAARADHLQLNGYQHPTTPLLTMRSNIVSYPHIYSEQTHTLASLPYMLTRADSTHEEYQYTETSFISIFRECGWHTSWISNQDLGPTFAHFPSECDTMIFANAGKSVYSNTQWLDEDLVPIMRSLHTHASGNSLYILHSIGSHWYYNHHVPEAMQVFKPVTNNKVVTGNSIEQIVNSYDNTIVYMDYFVDAVISSLTQEKAIVIYQSDHSEALGEDGEYLHANDTEMAKHPACIIWYSDQFATTYPDKIKVLVANKDKHYNTDYLFYSILSVAGIVANGDNSAANIFTP